MRTRRHSSLSDLVPEDNSGHQPHSPQANGHVSVLLHEVREGLAIMPDDVVVDATLGGAGHAKALAEKLGKDGVFIGFDADADAIVRAEKALAALPATVHLVNANFRTLRGTLLRLGVSRINKALFDLGWSSFQLSSGRGFSFLVDEPLAMTYAKPDGTEWILTAREIVNEWEEDSIADVIYGWGEEHAARRIAKAVIAAREQKPIETSRELAEIVSKVVNRTGKIHPATKTFQALRIAVNDEFGALHEGLQAAYEALEEGGRIAVISFHSAEDRIVKRTMKAWDGIQITKKPIVPSDEEITKNPRSRSAKLRIFEKPITK